MLIIFLPFNQISLPFFPHHDYLTLHLKIFFSESLQSEIFVIVLCLHVLDESLQVSDLLSHLSLPLSLLLQLHVQSLYRVLALKEEDVAGTRTSTLLLLVVEAAGVHEGVT